MNKEQKVTSLTLSKKIYELAKKKGIELESEYFWIETNQMGDDWEWELLSNEEISELDVGSRNEIPALDTAEWGELLPNQTICRKDFVKTTQNTIYSVDVANIEIKENIFAKTEAEARGQLYFYLLKKGLL